MRKITANVHQCQNCRRFRTRLEGGVGIGGWPHVVVEERTLIRRYQGTFGKFTPGTPTRSLAQVLPERSGIDGILHPVFVSPADYPMLSPGSSGIADTPRPPLGDINPLIRSACQWSQVTSTEAEDRMSWRSRFEGLACRRSVPLGCIGLPFICWSGGIDDEDDFGTNPK
jgi:hypothetical protein